MVFRPIRALAVRQLSATLVVLALSASVFNGCLADVGTAAAAMACCDHQDHGCTDAIDAAACCKTQNAGTRIADAFTFGSSPVAPPPLSTHLPIGSYWFDEPGLYLGDLSAPAQSSPPGLSPPRLLPLRI